MQALHVKVVADTLGLETGSSRKETDWVLFDMTWSLGSQVRDGLKAVK